MNHPVYDVLMGFFRIQKAETRCRKQTLAMEGTFLFCEDWEGPTVLGFHGFLERIRFAIDPDYEQYPKISEPSESGASAYFHFQPGIDSGLIPRLENR